MSGVLDRATAQPSVNIKGCNTVGLRGHNDEHSERISVMLIPRPQVRLTEPAIVRYGALPWPRLL